MPEKSPYASIPSVDRLLSSKAGRALIDVYGHEQVTNILRGELDAVRSSLATVSGATNHATNKVAVEADNILGRAAEKLAQTAERSLKPVMNLTGTVLHTNLGRASLPQTAIDAMAAVAATTSNLEFDLETGARGDRDAHVESILCDITGAGAATVVNNNAAAVLLTLNTLALDRDVPVSRGELVEIGGSFRIPDIMARAGARLVEVGTTNRTHLADYRNAVSTNTALVMSVHTSNYEISGFTKRVPERELAALAHEHGIPLVTDLGSGTLIDLTRYGLSGEPTVQDALASGADVVTFSGDKLLGGPQVGIIAGRADLIDAIRKNPMKRALRVDKLTIAALTEVLALYRDPDTLIEKLPTLRSLTRSQKEIRQLASAVAVDLEPVVSSLARIEVIDTESQIGSGALPTSSLPSAGIAVTPKDGTERSLQMITRAFRELPLPVLGRIHDGTLILDLRTLETAEPFTAQLGALDIT